MKTIRYILAMPFLAVCIILSPLAALFEGLVNVITGNEIFTVD